MNGSQKNNKVGWKVPTNIALIKYWGKKPVQIPQNPSLSVTLSDSYTETYVEYFEKASKSNSIQLEFYFDGKKNESFEKRILNFFNSIESELPFLTEYKFKISSVNSFPHSSGIASSASSMAALSLCLMSIYEEVNHIQLEKDEFLKKASYYARLGSGSAARSVFGGYAIWGENEFVESASDLYAIPFNSEIHQDFKKLRIAVLLVSSKEKEVSSSKGHELMYNHPFAEARFNQAHSNLGLMLDILKAGDKNSFFKLIETEALSLHAMMMSSTPSFLLLKPNSVAIVDKVREARRNGLDVGFTIDAGANIHVIYFENQKAEAHQFIQRELLQYCENNKWIDDKLGDGPIKI